MGEITERTIDKLDTFQYAPEKAFQSPYAKVVEKLYVTPSPLQWEVLLEDEARLILVAGGERAGKSWVSGLFGATRTPFGRLFWIVAADYELARPEFTYWVEHLKTLGAIRSDRDISMPKMGSWSVVTKSGQRIETKTAVDVRKIAAKAPDGIVMAEAAQMDYELFLKCNGRISEKRGWILMSGTFEGSSGWYPEMYEDFINPNNRLGGRAYSLPSWSNLIIFPGGREDPEIQRLEMVYERVEGMFEERCAAVPIPPTNLVFRDFRHTTHVGNFDFDPKLPVYLAVDPSSGGDPYSVLAVQFKEDEREIDRPDRIDHCYIIDEYYESGVITEDIIFELRRRAWWKNIYGGAIDVEATDEKKRWRKYGQVPLVAKKIDQMEGIRRLKTFLYNNSEKNAINHLHIDAKVKSLPFEFRNYKRRESTFSDVPGSLVDRPPGNQEDHSIKALWYLLIARYGAVKAPPNRKIGKTWQRTRV